MCLKINSLFQRHRRKWLERGFQKNKCLKRTKSIPCLKHSIQLIKDLTYYGRLVIAMPCFKSGEGQHVMHVVSLWKDVTHIYKSKNKKTKKKRDFNDFLEIKKSLLILIRTPRLQHLCVGHRGEQMISFRCNDSRATAEECHVVSLKGIFWKQLKINLFKVNLQEFRLKMSLIQFICSIISMKHSIQIHVNYKQASPLVLACHWLLPTTAIGPFMPSSELLSPYNWLWLWLPSTQPCVRFLQPDVLTFTWLYLACHLFSLTTHDNLFWWNSL